MKKEVRMKFTFIDLFAGAGGFSEGFLQIGDAENHFDFLLTSDINKDSELCHRLRYNHQLKMDAVLTEDLKSPRYIPQLKSNYEIWRRIEVSNLLMWMWICGGPPCQSFSLAGKTSRTRP